MTVASRSFSGIVIRLVDGNPFLPRITGVFIFPFCDLDEK